MTSVADPSMTHGRVTNAAAKPVASTRDIRLDFFRGIAMFIILCAHTPSNFFTSWIPARWGFSDATEIFVFCSGMASAIAFGRTFDRAGWTLGTGRVGYRVWQVYWAHIGMFVVIATMLAAFDVWGDFGKSYISSLNLQHFFENPAPQLVGLLTLSYVPNYFDILPMYLVILAMMPIIMALSRISLWAVAAAMGLTWLMAQEFLLDSLGLGQWHVAFSAEPWSNREWFFNPFGWQLIFFTGFAFMRGWLPKPPVNRVLIGIAAALVIANIPLSNIGVREFGFDWARDWRGANSWLFNKSDFGILRYIHFLALAYLCWAAAGEGGMRLRATGTGIISYVWGVLLKMILKVGQQSLAVFVFSMVFARFSGFVMDQIGRNTWNMTVANFVGFAALIAVAYIAGWFKSHPWRVAK
ncbi:OpgC protein [Roseovarius sp. AK1035]|uniref:OpgC protein n=1 Tax=Roseovarius mucosus TaxID=215743 RepID=A0A1V0RPP0_9RHOB|nr:MULTISPECIES: OpgC domain-containing protein [Roseovarius]ARE83744.1 OpgC protein [Roseovarius mucosus]AWZ19622.1 OpgC protein [Roseovarius sp. AK1035]